MGVIYCGGYIRGGGLIHVPHLTSININQVWYLLLIFYVKIYTI